MGDITVRYKFNIETGKHDIVVEYESDDDDTPQAHERRHQEIARRFAGGAGMIPAEDVGEIVIDRIKPGQKEPGRRPPEGRREGRAESR